MDVLQWMRRVCVVTFVLGGTGYLFFLAWWIHLLALGNAVDRWERECGYWLQSAAAPLVVILFSVMGYGLTCLADRFRSPLVPSPHEVDYGDVPRRPSPPV